jgi:hypothetical protein
VELKGICIPFCLDIPFLKRYYETEFPCGESGTISKGRYTLSALKEYRYFQDKQSILNMHPLIFPSKLTASPRNIGIPSISRKYRKMVEFDHMG